MESLYLIILVVLLLLAVSDLTVGVANDAVNFLNSAIGSKAAPRRVILIIASAGIMVGATFSSGMMEVARSGVFHPGMFTFAEIMMLFLAVMFTDVILLDVFNTFGLPTSTTVSLVFGLLGSAIAVALVSIGQTTGLSLVDLGDYINSGKTMAIISGILVSVVIAFTCGILIMYITRLIFSFRYKRTFRYLGGFWCGIAFTAISYFAVFKGLKGTTLISPENYQEINAHIGPMLVEVFLGWSLVMFILQHLFKINILKITVLAGTFSLALAFAGNDLVNFIGVFMAGVDSYQIALQTGDTQMLMSQLNQPIVAETWILLIAGGIMVITLWLSKKSRTVTETEVNLSRQDDGVERFGSTLISRSLVRGAIQMNRRYEQLVPTRIQDFISHQFAPLPVEERDDDRAPFDLIRATVNLTVASLLISMATSLKLPLSTTYVTFMVAMGSSLADKAWGRESAVYRITGVLTVISGWFLTALVAFTLAFGIANALMYGQLLAVIALTVLAGFLLVRSNLVHKKRVEVQEEKKKLEIARSESPIVDECVREICETMEQVTKIYNNTLFGLFREDRKLLKNMVLESEKLYDLAHDRKYEALPTLQKLQDDDVETAHYYVQVVDYMNEVTKSLVHITRPSYEHINNNHEGLGAEQIDDLMEINNRVSRIYEMTNKMLRSGDFRDLDTILSERDSLFETLAEAIKNQIRRTKAGTTSTRSSLLYLGIVTESKTMILQSRNLLKSQKYFVSQ